MQIWLTLLVFSGIYCGTSIHADSAIVTKKLPKFSPYYSQKLPLQLPLATKIVAYLSAAYAIGAYTYDHLLAKRLSFLTKQQHTQTYAHQKLQKKLLVQRGYPSLSSLHHHVARCATGLLVVAFMHALFTIQKELREKITHNCPFTSTL